MRLILREYEKTKIRFNRKTDLIFRILERLYGRWIEMRKSLYLQGKAGINNSCSHNNNGSYITEIMNFQRRMRRNGSAKRIKIKIKKAHFGHSVCYNKKVKKERKYGI